MNGGSRDSFGFDLATLTIGISFAHWRNEAFSSILMRPRVVCSTTATCCRPSSKVAIASRK